MSWEGVNRRRFPRAHYACTIRIRMKGSVEALQTKTENIGCGGICVMLAKRLNLFSGAELEVDIEDGNQPIRCDATVVWVVARGALGSTGSTAYDTGLEFVNLKDGDRVRIDEIVKKVIQENPELEDVEQE